MVDLAELVAYLEEELGTPAISDYPGALNGLQLANGGAVERIVAAVDASLPVIRKAVSDRPSLLLVHHGMFWQGAQPLTGAFYWKIRLAMEGGLAIYSSHLPLDLHPVLGNNAVLARRLGVVDPVPFLPLKGQPAGLRGEWRGTREELAGLLASMVGGPVHVCPGGTGKISKVGVVTGGAGSEVARAAAAGVDAFITGEGPHWSYPLAEELGIDVFYAGHYATETFGVKALAESLATRFGLPWEFVDHPTGL